MLPPCHVLLKVSQPAGSCWSCCWLYVIPAGNNMQFSNIATCCNQVKLYSDRNMWECTAGETQLIDFVSLSLSINTIINYLATWL